MQNEQRLIDADAAVDAIADAAKKYDGYDSCQNKIIQGFMEAQDALASVPTVDAVEVVRCKDCKYFRKGKPFSHECKKVGGGMFYPNPNDFCSYGERREGE